MELRLLTAAELAAAYDTDLKEAFPPAELKPLSSMEDLRSRGLYDPLCLFDDVVESMAKTMQERMTPLKIECETDTLMVDADLIRSALINLVDNASKASDAGRTVVLKAYGRTIEVVDSGKGIPENEIARITEPFYMIDPSRNRKNGGSGLGLALVCEIVRAHGAALSIESEVGKGTVVKIEFPENNLKAT